MNNLDRNDDDWFGPDRRHQRFGHVLLCSTTGAGNHHYRSAVAPEQLFQNVQHAGEILQDETSNERRHDDTHCTALPTQVLLPAAQES